MTERTIFQDRKHRTFLSIPAYLRDKFHLKNGDMVEINDTGGSIVITPIKEQ
ncbi:AbrB/MazE/SpoVT family DNA-binding domain-containing protein [uncultured Methanolobus sp.]|uniref:AbrB/MazE/SpoVT family DNA-binding domain-containing protein n=1 Tax=uncultured Methanolobus sp. TaxID=218300 RepID=UPI0037498D6B